jgi:hypothetical protein
VIKKPAVSIPKVERALKKRPSAFIDKSSRPGLETRPDVKAYKASPMLQKRPDSISNKMGGK